MSTKIDITMFLLFPWKSLTEFQGIGNFLSPDFGWSLAHGDSSAGAQCCHQLWDKVHTARSTTGLLGTEEDFCFLQIHSSLPKDLQGHRCAQLAGKSRVSLSGSPELGSRAQLPSPAGHPHWAAHLDHVLHICLEVTNLDHILWYSWIKAAQPLALFALLFGVFFFRHCSLLNFNLPRRDWYNGWRK